jgi:hypothetical protein
MGLQIRPLSSYTRPCPAPPISLPYLVCPIRRTRICGFTGYRCILHQKNHRLRAHCLSAQRPASRTSVRGRSPATGRIATAFHIYALDTDVDFTIVADVEQLPSALKGHVLGSGQLTGTRTS